jgi:hypothetical protein
VPSHRRFRKFIFVIAQAEQFLYGLEKPRYTRFPALMNRKPMYLNKLDDSLNIKRSFVVPNKDEGG